MRWPWERREKRQIDGYSAIVRAALHRAASGNIGQITDLAAVQGSAALLGRSLSVARVEPAAQLVEGVTPEFMYSVGVRLILEGRAVDLLDVGDDGIPMFYPASHWTVTGTYRRDTHSYSLTLAGADGEATSRITAGSSGVFDVVAGSRWLGSSAALLGSSSSARASAELEAALADEASGPRGSLYAVPAAVGEDAPGIFRVGKSDWKSARSGCANRAHGLWPRHAGVSGPS